MKKEKQKKKNFIDKPKKNQKNIAKPIQIQKKRKTLKKSYKELNCL